jgi:hypothetical protein
VSRHDGVELGWTVQAPPDGDGDLAFAAQITGVDWVAPHGDGAEILDTSGVT